MQQTPLSLSQLIGKTFGRYTIEQQLGAGKVNAVYTARPSKDNSSWLLDNAARVMLTIFILPDHFTAQARSRFMDRFTSLAGRLAQLKHPNILPTYDFGEQYGYPYLVTPLVTTGSLAKVLKQRQRCSPTQALAYLKQIASALDDAHALGVVHGSLKPANILLETPLSPDEAQGDPNVIIAGFGLVHLLEMRSIEPQQLSAANPQAHLLSIAGTFLGTAEYIAPEVALGGVLDTRADIYALGVVLFELLSGRPPFSGGDPFSVALEHAREPAPSLQLIRPDIPAALDLVIQRALERDPAQRIPSAGKLLAAYERVMQVINRTGNNAGSGAVGGSSYVANAAQQPARLPIQRDMTLPPTVDWFADEPSVPKLPDTGERLQWLGTDQYNANSLEGSRQVPPPPTQGFAAQDSGSWQILPPMVSGKLPAIPASPASPTTSFSSLRQYAVGNDAATNASPVIPDGVKTVDPFVWWSTSTMAATKIAQPDQPGATRQAAQPGTFKTDTAVRPASNGKRKRTGPDKGRRRTVAVLAGGGVIAAGVLATGSYGLIRLMSNNQPATNGNQANAQVAATSTTGKQPDGTTATAQPTTGATNSPTKQPAGTPTAQPTAGATSTPTTQPTPNPSPTPPPGHTGTVIGSTNMGNNTTKAFTNPADGAKGILIHLGGNFYAYEVACTHEGVPVQYNANTQMLVCPRHGALFDPANNGAVTKGPATRPLARVTIKVNADGTITTGR